MGLPGATVNSCSQPEPTASLRDMAASRLNEKWMRPTEDLLVWGFIISLTAHLIFAGIYYAGQKYGWWERARSMFWIKKAQEALAAAQKTAQLQPEQNPLQEIQLQFIDVDPNQVTQEKPKDTPFYSAVNALAANRNSDIDSNKPKLEGEQKDSPKTQTSENRNPFPLQPKAERGAEQKEETQEPKPKGGPKVGDLAMAKPQDKPGDGKTENAKGQSEAPVHKRPRTLAEAGKTAPLPGLAMKQEGGVKRKLDLQSFDVKGTQFGEYDAAFIRAVSLRWYTLMDEPSARSDSTGRVTLEFRLYYDGRISEIKVLQNSAGVLMGYLCQRAVTDSAPYERWPDDMRRIIGADYREITFTFNIY
jgi:outer membrane biosynthesis protein TonB